MEINERLKAAREAAGISQSELARRMAVDRNIVNMAENGRQLLSIKHLRSFCEVVGISADELLCVDHGAIRKLAMAQARKEMTDRLNQFMAAVEYA